LCVETIESRSRTSQSTRERSRVDYRERLSEENYRIYEKLRDLRKEIGTAEGVPLYNVFTNKQLADMIEKKARTKADLESLEGIADNRVDKYGKRFLEILAKEWDKPDEADEQTV
jgi:superfamily II DNA helicase RecQ